MITSPSDLWDLTHALMGCVVDETVWVSKVRSRTVMFDTPIEGAITEVLLAFDSRQGIALALNELLTMTEEAALAGLP